MSYVITSECVDVKDGACQVSCPVDCIYIGGRMMYIHPDECIDCGLCLSVCPVDAIYAEDQVPTDQLQYIKINEEFFSDQVTGWGSPGGAEPPYETNLDHPMLAELVPCSA